MKKSISTTQPTRPSPFRERISFARVPSRQLYDDLLDVQIRSYEEFLQEDVPHELRKPVGLQKAFLMNFPVEDNQGILQVDFLGYTIERPRYTEEECRERELTYAKTLKAKLRLSSKADPSSEDYIEAIEQEVYMGTIPAMTPRGTFIINGAERVVVSQIHRSPGVFFDETIHANGMKLHSARIIPFKGSWVEFTTDINNLLYAYIDRKKKFLATTFLRALRRPDGTPFCSTDEEILTLFDVTEKITISHLDDSFVGRIVATDAIDYTTGEVLVLRNSVLDEELIDTIRRSKISSIVLYRYTDPNDEPIIKRTLDKDTTRTHEDALEMIYRQIRASEPPDMESAWHVILRICFDDKRYDIGEVGRFRINRKLEQMYKEISVEPPPLATTILTNEDIVATVRYLLGVHEGRFPVDDVDHLSNRRVRTVGEQLASIYMTGITRLARGVKDKLTVQDLDELSPAALTNARAVTSVVNQFFGTNQLSQFMDQTNPLAELTHKRRVSALGPGGLTRERAGFEVRDVHYTHYGRLCPIETPEGPNIGLISSLAMHARINRFGFIETPYRKVKNGKVSDEIEYLSAEDEEGKVIAPASTPIDDKGRIVGPRVRARRSGDYVTVNPEEVQYLDISTDQIISPAASLIPFLEHDDANRALMGSNMQRQAVPLIRPDAPLVGTGMEARIARDARALLLAEDDGVVEHVSADCIRIRYDDPRSEEEKLISFQGDRIVEYPLLSFFRTNQDTSICQRPIVRVGDRVTRGMPIADGACTDRGELALGRNVLVAFMPWRGYNFEDAIIVSERLIAEDVFTSVHIEEFTAVVRDTKRGEEEFTRDIPSMSEDMIKDLDEHGVVRVGTKVKEGDILIGKVTPKGEVDPTPEEKLLRAIFGDRAGEVKDASLKAPPGLRGTVINTKLFQRRFIVSDAEYRAEEKRRRDAIDRQEHEELAALDRDCLERLAKLLDGHQSIGVATVDGKRVYMSGTRITRQNLFDKYQKGDLVLMELDLTLDWVADERIMSLVRKLMESYRIRRNEIQAHARVLRNRATLGEELQSGVLAMAKVFVAKKRKLQVGDKMAGRHGNKGIVSKIVPIEDMPFLPDGTPVDIILNPLGVPSRMNLGQLYETALGWAASKLGLHFASPVFDGATWEQVGDYLEKAGLPRDGKTVLYDGRTGEPFEHKVTVGVIYMMKLSHMVEDKIHARSIGPYSLITQQPLGGKAQFGGQRLGEMEVWALEAYGATATLQEMLTVKSDDVNGRSKMYEAIVKGFNAPQPNLPEAFMVLVRELQGLCLDVRLDAQRLEERIS
ncbi:MAG: DNA-directed RNA polymerase subunit beta [Chlorobi bacterium]|nr:DNA-directed RNA polymerase subunit beta [Chlorobiota bacterium]